MCAEHQNARKSHADDTPVGLISRMPVDTPTAPDPSQISDIQAAARHELDAMRSIIDGLGLGFFDWDLPDKEMWFSSYANKMLGYDAGDAASTENLFAKTVHPEDGPVAQAQQDALFSGQVEDYRCHVRLRHKDGTWKWFAIHGRVPLRAEDGTPLRMCGTFTCIHDQIQEQADAGFLDALTSALLPLQDATAIQMCALEQLGEYLGVDRISFGNFDRQQRSMVFKTNWTRTGRAPLGGAWPSHIVADALRVTLRAGGQLSIADVTQDTRTCAADKVAIFRETGTAAFVAAPLVIGGDVQALLLVCQSTPRDWRPHELALIDTVGRRLWDAVLRARAVEQSKSSHSLLRLALQIGKIGARELDVETGEADFSENFFSVIGHPQVSDMTVDEYISHVHPEDRAHFMSLVERARTDPDASFVADEHRIITADEEVRHIALVSQYPPIDERRRNPRSYLTVVQDVTGQRERELEAERANSQLLKQSRLSAMGVMASTLAHELNQPLATAANYLSLIQSLTESGGRSKTKETSTYITRALTKVLEAGEIIRRIRSFTADGQVSTAPHGLRDLVFRALSSLFGRAGSAEIAIINAVPKAILVEVEPLLVEHAISNVVRNAVDAMAGQTGGRLLITAVPDADTIWLEIADNGPGIRADMADNIFSPFVTNKPQGTGLGLAISRTMVEAIGGKILLKRHAPGDTAFCLCLPRAATPEHEHEG